MSDESKVKTLNQVDLEEFKKSFRGYMQNEGEIQDCRGAQKDIIKELVDNLEGWKKKEVKQIFTLLKKDTSSDDIREMADVMDEVTRK